MTEQEYRETDRISQSYLTLLDKHPNLAKRYLDGEHVIGDSEELKIGSGVDALVTKGEDDFKEEFEVISERDKPTGNILNLTKKIYLDKEDSSLDEKISYYYDKLDLREGLEKVKNKFYHKGGELYLKKLQSGKHIITPEQEMNIRDIVESLKTNRFTKKYLKNKNLQYQVPLFFEIGGHPCKGLIDMLIIDEDSKLIIPIDLKVTSYSLASFDKAIFQKRYDLQADMYKEGLRQNYSELEYTITPFKFIVENMNFPGTPLIYKYQNRGLSERSYDGKVYKGPLQLLEENEYHRKYDVWDYKRDVLEMNGEIKV